MLRFGPSHRIFLSRPWRRIVLMKRHFELLVCSVGHADYSNLRPGTVRGPNAKIRRDVPLKDWRATVKEAVSEPK